MKRILKIYSPYIFGILMGVPIIFGLIYGYGPETFDAGEVIGYSSMIVAMALIFVAVKNHRDKVNKGSISFGEAMRIGLSLSGIGGLAWGLYNFIFVTWIMPDFNEQYLAHQEGLEIGTSAFQEKFDALMNSSESFMYTPLGGTILMFVTVFLIGTVISIISGLVLKS
ncbi:DUF4199 domain-containing protein [Roseivirga misakiensis]|uniref:DUF4199 domain-containing protein n=1 Tax=Roseivirga misakiensis TaxID=1563681 RepID=A0A1E5SKZ4_9BACT|nr:DUF4199 domain-containing protein [Roseivirga misakiensis]OEJ99716.1 hypothetical protein BFP71_09105 [Roseivirga misakiensis]